MADALGHRRRQAAVPALAVAELTSWGVLYYAMAVLVDPMHAATGWDPTVVSMAFSVGLLTSGLTAPVAGRLLDSAGPRVVMAFGSFLGAGGMVLWGSASTLPGLFCAWVVIGVGMAATLYEPAFAAVVQFVPQRKHESIVLVSLVGALAATVFQPATSLLAESLGWRQTTWVLALVLLVVTLPLHLTLPSGRHRRSVRERVPLAKATEPSVRGVTLPFAVAAAVATGVTFNLVLALLARGLTVTAAAWWAGTLGVAKIVGRTTVGVLARSRAATTVTQWTLAAMAVALALPGVSSTATVLGAHVLLFGASTGALTVLRPLVVAELVGPTSFATSSGKVARTVTLAAAGGPPMMTFGASLLGGHDIAGVVAASVTGLIIHQFPRPSCSRIVER